MAPSFQVEGGARLRGVGPGHQDGDVDTRDALDAFAAPTRAWFAERLGDPTPAQALAWEAISSSKHALVVAPTGSGKTLAAFLWAVDRLLASPGPADPRHRCRVLYVSPLKALAADVE